MTAPDFGRKNEQSGGPCALRLEKDRGRLTDRDRKLLDYLIERVCADLGREQPAADQTIINRAA
jgi:hypothetical protein